MLIQRLGLLLSLLIVLIQSPLHIEAAGAFEVEGVKVAIVRSDGSPSTTIPGTYPKDVLTGTELQPDEQLQVSLSIKADGAAIKPQQVMLKLTSDISGASAYAVGKAKGSEYTIQASHATLERQLGKLSGPFKVSLLLGDSSVTKALSWELGALEVKPFTVPADPAPAVATATTQKHVFSKPEIVHMHRAPEKRPPGIVSLAFTGLAFAPLLLLVAIVGSLKPNFKGWPSGSAGLAALLFHGGIVAMVVLYMLFWLRMTLVQTVPIVLLLGLFIAVTGYRALSGVATGRLADAKSKRE